MEIKQKKQLGKLLEYKQNQHRAQNPPKKKGEEQKQKPKQKPKKNYKDDPKYQFALNEINSQATPSIVLQSYHQEKKSEMISTAL